jgi:hypothetical protein
LENLAIGSVIGELNASDPDANATFSYSLIDLNGSTDNAFFQVSVEGILSTGREFDYETGPGPFLAGIRVTDEHNGSFDQGFSISVLNVVEDFDGDGVEDAYDFDDDNDGYTDVQELAYGSDPLDPNSNPLTAANNPPSQLDLNATSPQENSPVGTMVGQFSASDPDVNATFTYLLVDSNSTPDNQYFNLSPNGLLATALAIDFESISNPLNITVQVADEYNATLSKVFPITIINVVEDFDSDGIEDAYDLDDDGDGYTDLQELAYLTDPFDPNSYPLVLANNPPVGLDLNGSEIMEGRPAGWQVGTFSGVDPDINSTFTYSLVDGNGSTDNSSFALSADGILSTAVEFDFESQSAPITIRVLVMDEYNATFSSSFSLSVLNVIEDFDSDGIEDAYDPDDDNDGFSDIEELAYGSDPMNPLSIANLPPNGLDLNGSVVLVDRPVGTQVGSFLGIDPDINSTLIYSLVDGNGSMDNTSFVLSSEGILSTAVLFDSLNAPQVLYIRVHVSDERNASYSESFSVTVQPAVQPVDFSNVEILLSSQKIEENLPSNTMVGKLTVSGLGDQEGIENIQFSLNSNNVENDFFFIDDNHSLRTTQELNFEQTAQHIIGVRLSLESGEFLDQNLSIFVVDSFIPIVETGDPVDVGFQEATLSGKLLDKGSSLDLIQIGMLVSTDPNPNLNTKNIIQEKGFLDANDNFETMIMGLEKGQKYFYRTYAMDAEGIGYGVVKDFVTQKHASGPAWAKAQPGGAVNWWSSSWFGSFYINDENAWIMHSELGWLYPFQSGQSGIWLWQENLGWLWTDEQYFPFLYQNTSAGWLYFYGTSGNKMLFYHYRDERWIQQTKQGTQN